MNKRKSSQPHAINVLMDADTMRKLKFLASEFGDTTMSAIVRMLIQNSFAEIEERRRLLVEQQ